MAFDVVVNTNMKNYRKIQRPLKIGKLRGSNIYIYVHCIKIYFKMDGFYTVIVHEYRINLPPSIKSILLAAFHKNFILTLTNINLCLLNHSHVLILQVNHKRTVYT